jgi:hypothetical protein
MENDKKILNDMKNKKEKKTTYKTIKKKDLFELPKKDKSKNKVINKIKVKKDENTKGKIGNNGFYYY